MEKIAFAARMHDLGGDVVRNMFLLTENPDIISFAGGMPSPDALPAKQLHGIADELIRDAGRQILQYGTIEGYQPLREWLAKHVAQQGIETSPDQVLITSGAQQGIDLAAKSFMNPGDCVLVERPTYLAALTIFKTYEVEFGCVDSDDYGIIPESFEEAIARHNPKMLYVVPTFQNPTGVTLPAERRKAVAEIAGKHGVIVVEDDPYAKLRYDGEPVPSIASYDKNDVVIFLGSFSKFISPGLRVGYAVSPPKIHEKLAEGKQTTDFHTSNLSQRMIYEFCTRGHLEPHLESIRKDYVVKRDAALRALEKHFPKGARWTHPQGGLFIWVVLPEYIDTNELLPKAAARNVAYIPGVPFYADGGGKNAMRLNFSNASLEQLDRGIKSLGEVVAEAMGV